tara:strand:- start:586 stop:828 length:243 start_codon:yes stop_codon:yes gene_type:complete
MKILTTFVLIGVVDSKDDFFATVEIQKNPQTEQHGHAVLPLHAFPCKINEGDTFYILKLTAESEAVILCKQDRGDTNNGE